MRQWRLAPLPRPPPRYLPTRQRAHPRHQRVSLEIGAFTLTIPAGSFRADRKGRFKLEGTIDGVALEAVIRPLGLGRFDLKAEGRGANLRGLTNPVTVGLLLGDDGGRTTVLAELE